MNQNIIIIKLENSSIGFNILTEGRFASAKQVKYGLDLLINKAVKQFKLRKDIISKLIFYNVDLYKQDHSNSPIHLWSIKNNTYQLSEQELYDCISSSLMELKTNIIDLLAPIVKLKSTRVVIVGQGAELQKFDKLLSESLGCKVENYIPETLGARNGIYVSPLGATYAYKDNLTILNNESSVDLIAYNQVLNKIRIEDVEQTVTTKLKNIFEKRKENIEDESRI